MPPSQSSEVRTAETLLAQARQRGIITVSFGAWEPDPDVEPIYTGRMPGWRGGWAELRPSIGGWRRKRFESARIDGEHVGRWTWEKRSA